MPGTSTPLLKPGMHSAIRKRNSGKKQQQRLVKTVRLIYSDPDATDSSSDDEQEDSEDRLHTSSGVKRMVKKVRIFGSLPNAKKKPVNGENCYSACEKNTKLVERDQKGMTGKSKFVGVRMRKWGKWSAEIRDHVLGIRKWLGTYNTEEEAHMAYEKQRQEFQDLKEQKRESPSSVLDVSNTASHRGGHTKAVPNTASHRGGHTNAVPNTASHGGGHTKAVPNTASRRGGHTKAVPNIASRRRGHTKTVPNTASQGGHMKAVPNTASQGPHMKGGHMKADNNVNMPSGFNNKKIKEEKIGIGDESKLDLRNFSMIFDELTENDFLLCNLGDLPDGPELTENDFLLCNLGDLPDGPELTENDFLLCNLGNLADGPDSSSLLDLHREDFSWLNEVLHLISHG